MAKDWAIVIPTVWQAAHSSYDVGELVDGFQKVKCNVRVICTEGSVFSVSYPVQMVVRECMTDPDFWLSTGLKAVLIFTWMGQADVVRAAREAGLYVLCLGDTDGLIGARAYPAANFCRMFYGMATPLGRLRAVWHWAKKVSWLYREEDTCVIESLHSAHFTLVQCDMARIYLRRFLDMHQIGELDGKVRVVPFPIADHVLQMPLNSAKRDKMVAIGRWDDPQKDAGLMAHSLRRYLIKYPQTEVDLIGRGGERWFHSLTQQFPNVTYSGLVPHQEIGTHLQDARVILFTSRWEGMPNAAHEALACGCAVAGVPIPSLQSICEAGDFGTLARNRSAASMAHALEQERWAWLKGKRDPSRIADYWRPRLSSATVAQQIIDLMQESKQENERKTAGAYLLSPGVP